VSLFNFDLKRWNVKKPSVSSVSRTSEFFDWFEQLEGFLQRGCIITKI